MSENNDYIQLPPLKKDTPSDVVAFMWEYMKVLEDSREKVKNLIKDAISSFGTTSYSVRHTRYVNRSASEIFVSSPV